MPPPPPPIQWQAQFKGRSEGRLELIKGEQNQANANAQTLLSCGVPPVALECFSGQRTHASNRHGVERIRRNGPTD